MDHSDCKLVFVRKMQAAGNSANAALERYNFPSLPQLSSQCRMPIARRGTPAKASGRRRGVVVQPEMDIREVERQGGKPGLKGRWKDRVDCRY